MRTRELPADLFVNERSRIENDFNEACEWLKTLGVFHPSCRFAHYQRIFSTDDYLESDDRFAQYLSAIGEAAELIRIRKSMEKINSDEFIIQLKKATSGHPFKLAIESDRGRDFAFELSVAARFIAAGYAVTLGGIADAVAHVGQHKIYIESKRVQSTSKIMRRLSEARDQLTSRLKADPSSRARGMVVCHVTDIINPEGLKPIYAHAEDFRPASENAVLRYVQENEFELRKKIKNKHLGILFESILVGVVFNEEDPSSIPAFMHCRGASMYRFGLGEQDEKLIQSMAPRLANQSVFA